MNEKKKLNIYMFVAENSGVGYYRQFLPATALRDTRTANVYINDFRWGEGDHVEPTEKVFFEVCNWADILVVGRHDIPTYYAKWAAARQFFNIPIVLDTDDNVQHVRPSNPGYMGYHPGAEALIWNHYAITRVFDALTVSTDNLKQYYSKRHPRIYTLPNSLDVPTWQAQKRPETTDGKVRMAFICSAAHAEGFGLLQRPLYNILRKYPQIEFYYPDPYWRIFQGAPEEVKSQLKSIPWIKLKEFPKALTEMGIDIGLAPLKDNNFNRGKSNLRYLEYSMAGMACIVSPVEPYAKTVHNGVNGIVAKEEQEWYDAMELLVTDGEKRKQIARSAKELVENKFDIFKNCVLWDNVYREIMQKYHDFYGKKKRFMDVGKGKYQEILPSSILYETYEAEVGKKN